MKLLVFGAGFVVGVVAGYAGLVWALNTVPVWAED